MSNFEWKIKSLLDPEPNRSIRKVNEVLRRFVELEKRYQITTLFHFNSWIMISIFLDNSVSQRPTWSSRMISMCTQASPFFYERPLGRGNSFEGEGKSAASGETPRLPTKVFPMFSLSTSSFPFFLGSRYSVSFSKQPVVVICLNVFENIESMPLNAKERDEWFREENQNATAQLFGRVKCSEHVCALCDYVANWSMIDLKRFYGFSILLAIPFE